MDHIQKNNIEKFHQGTGIDTGDMIRCLEHLDHCDYCLEQMILEESAGSETRAPSWLSDEVLGRAASPEVQAAKMLSDASRRSRLFYYRLQRSEEHTSELQSRFDLVCRLLLEKKKQKILRINDMF